MAVALATGVIIMWPAYYTGGLLRDFQSLVPNLRKAIASGPSYHSLIADSPDQAKIA
jgi:hypothetical protein